MEIVIDVSTAYCLKYTTAGEEFNSGPLTEQILAKIWNIRRIEMHQLTADLIALRKLAVRSRNSAISIDYIVRQTIHFTLCYQQFYLLER